jgi:hypothetical protein
MLKIGTPVQIKLPFSKFDKRMGKIIDIKSGVLCDMFKVGGKVLESFWFFEHQLMKLEVKGDGPRPSDI